MHELALPEVTLQAGLRWLDLLGVLAFSLSGALLGVRKRFDLFGVLVLGCVTAVGGGAIRDTLTGQAPPLFLRDETYLWVAFAGALSGVGGGIIRDLIANEVPEVMYRRDQLYATAAASGALAVYLLHPHVTPFQAQLGGALTVLLLRYVSRRGWVRLPVRRLPGG